MDKIMAMREKRAEMWEQAKQFLDSHEKDGRLTAEDAKAYEQMSTKGRARSACRSTRCIFCSTMRQIPR